MPLSKYKYLMTTTMTKKLKFITALVVTLFICTLFMVSPVFYFTEIKVTGNIQIEDEEILNLANLDYSTNFFLFRPRRARQSILNNHFIEQVDFNRTLPSFIEISVEERFISGYIRYPGGLFLYIDENGRVIDVRSYMKEPKPVIAGLDFSKLHLGQKLDVSNPDAFSTVVTFAGLINRHGLADIITEIDVSDPANARLRIYNIEVYLGDTSRANEKILTLREIVNEWPLVTYVRGFLDLRELSSEYIFRILT